MQRFLVHLASLTVMLHMTMGCTWHHGLGLNACLKHCDAGGCENTDSQSLEADATRHPAECDHDHSGDTPGDSAQILNPAHAHCHLGCQDDHCIVNQRTDSKRIAWNFPAIFMGETAAAAITASLMDPPHQVTPFADFQHTWKPVRAHLWFGVQLL